MSDELITSMHPPGSANDMRYFEPEPPRTLYRPPTRYLLAGTSLLATVTAGLAVYCLVYIILACCGYSHEYSHTCGVCLCILAALAIVYAVRRSVLIYFIMLYQHYAPKKVRLRCLFSPSCSDYMILSILKYGVIRGVYNGIKRLKRCHSPNGGVDYP